MQPRKIVALTGGAGFIGGHFLKHLIRRGYGVRALARKPGRLPFEGPDIEVIYGSLHDQPALKKLTHNADAVIHCAGRVKGMSAQQFNFDNIEGTKNLLAHCKSVHKAQKFIFISSLAARRPELSAYARSKQSSESELQKSHLKNWLIIRPPAVYGPGDRQLKPLFDCMQRGALFIPGKTSQHFSLIHIEDLTQLTLCQLESNTLNRQIIEPDDGRAGGYRWQDIRAIASAYFQRNIRAVKLPPLFLHSCARINLFIAAVFRTSPMLTPGKIRELLHDNWVSDNQLAAHWSPTIDLKTGLGTLYSGIRNL